MPDKQATPSTTVPKPANSTTDSADLGDPATLASKGDPSSSRDVLPAGDSGDARNGDARNGKDNPPASEIDGTQRASADPKAPARLVSQQEDGSQSLSPGLGALIHSTSGKFGPEAGGIVDQICITSVRTTCVQEVSIGRDKNLSVDPLGAGFQEKAHSIGGKL